MRDEEIKAAKNLAEYRAKLKEMAGLLSWVWRNFITADGKRYARRIIFFSVLGMGIGTVNPVFLGMIVNGVAADGKNATLVLLGLAGFAADRFFGRIIFRQVWRARELLFGDNQRQLDQVTSRLFFEKSLGQHIDENNKLSEANVKKGYGRIVELRNIMLHEGVEAVLGMLLPYVALLVFDWRIFAGVTVILVGHLAWSIYLNQKMLSECGPIDEKWRELERHRVERWDRVERVKTAGKEAEELEVLGQKFECAIVPDRKFWLWYIDQGILRSTIVVAAVILIFGYAARRAYLGELSPGALLPLIMWINNFLDSLWRVGQIEQRLNYATPSIMSMKEALTLPVGISIAETPVVLPKDAPGKVSFEHVSHVYTERSKDGGEQKTLPVLDDISFTIEPGEKVALVGESGVGKTTIMRLLLRYMDPTSGSIRIDGRDLKDLDLSSWLARVGYIPQQAMILDGTIRYNLLYGLSAEQAAAVTDERLWEIVRLLRIDFGERLTNGLDTVVGRNGIKLSGGQAQRVMIGAAVMKDPRLLVIDEATSSLDAVTEREVQEGLEQVLQGERSALIITHRLSTVARICDKFVFLSGNGNGSKIELVAKSIADLSRKSPEFRKMAEMQKL